MGVTGNGKRFKGAIEVTGHFDLVFAVDGLDSLGITSVAGVTAIVSGWVVLLVAQVYIHLTLKKTLVELRMKVVHKTLHIFFCMKLFQKFIVKDSFGKRVLAG